jgi:hypothetical protein
MADEGMVTRTRRGETGRPVAQIQKVRPERWTAEKREAFLAELAVTANVRHSARTVNMSEQGVHRLRKRSAEFRAAWSEALAEGYDLLELMMLERAMKGTEKPVFHGGAQIGTMREYPERVAMALLAQHRAEVTRFRAEQAGGGTAVVERVLDKLAEMNLRMGGDG